MARRSDHTREELRDLFLEAAAALVAEKGPEALNVRAIADRVGYSPGSLYNVFRNVDGLVLHLNSATMARLHETLETDVAEAPEAALRRLALSYADFAIANTPIWSLLFDYPFKEETELPDWYLAQIGQLLGLLEGPAAALTGDEPPARRRARAFAMWSSVHGICTLLVGRHYRTFEDFDVRQMIGLLAETLIAGLKHGGDPKP